MGTKPQEPSDGRKQIPIPLRGNQSCTIVQSHSDHIQGSLHNLAISTGREWAYLIKARLYYHKISKMSNFLRVYLVLFRVNPCLIWNYFWHFKERGIRTKFSFESVSGFLTKAVQPAGMFHILSSPHNKARSGEVHWINTASVYHVFNGLSIIPKSTWHLCGSPIRYA